MCEGRKNNYGKFAQVFNRSTTLLTLVYNGYGYEQCRINSNNLKNRKYV